MTNADHFDWNISFSVGDYYKAQFADKNINFFVSKKWLTNLSIEAAKSAIQPLKSEGFNLVEAEAIFSQAEDAFKAGDYIRAKSLSEQAKSNAEAVGKEAMPVKIAINEANSNISQEKAKGFNVVDADSLLSQAENAFRAGDYERAKELAMQAKAKALDIDGDGVPNDADFAPSIKNTYVYAGIIVLFLGIFMTSKGAKWYIARRKDERMHIEEMKQGILDKIEEVTKK